MRTVVTESSESDMRFFTSGFFDESVSPGPTCIGLYGNLQKYSKVQVNQCMVSTTPAINEHFFRLEVFSYILRCCWVAVYTHMYNEFVLRFTLRCR
jgi:hypothetical protein